MSRYKVNIGGTLRDDKTRESIKSELQKDSRMSKQLDLLPQKVCEAL